MRVVYVVMRLNVGGIVIYLRVLVLGLIECGLEV